MITSVKIVELISPATTVIAMGVRISAPSPKPSAIGNRPSTVVDVVIKIGRNRTSPACTIASSLDEPLRRKWLI